MEFGQLREKFLFRNHAENKAGGLVPDLCLVFIKAYEIKAGGLHLRFSIF